MNDAVGRMREKRPDDEGFTLIELLVVVVIIGVLVAIAVPVYLNYRQGAADKSAQSDVRGAISAMEQFYTDNGNKYPDPGTVDMVSESPGPIVLGANHRVTLSDKTIMTIYVANDTATSYTVCAKNTGGTLNKHFVYNSQTGGSVSSVTSAAPGFMTACTP